MSLKYVCDICGEDTEPGDCYGPGVITEVQGQGRPKVWSYTTGLDPEPALSVLPILEGSDNQFCGKCVGMMMRAMVNDLWPEDQLARDLHVEARRNTPGTEEYTQAHGEKWNRASPSVPPFDPIDPRSDHAEDTAGGDRADSDVQELRAVEPVPKPRPAVPAPFPHRCSSCQYLLTDNPPGFCTKPFIHSPG